MPSPRVRALAVPALILVAIQGAIVLLATTLGIHLGWARIAIAAIVTGTLLAAAAVLIAPASPRNL